MKILYNIANSGGGYVTLMDVNLGNTCTRWNPDFTQKPQIEDLASNIGQGASVYTNTLGNIRVALSLEININYLDASAALTASRTLATALLNLLINLQVIETNGATTETQYFPACVFTRAKPDVQGSNITWQFDLTSQMVTAVPPL